MDDVPIYFVAKKAVVPFLVYVAVGAAVGAAIYFNEYHWKTNMLDHVNKRIVDEYYPNLR